MSKERTAADEESPKSARNDSLAGLASPGDRTDSQTNGESVLQGLPVSPGVGIGKAFRLYDIPVAPSVGHIENDAPLEELARLEEAIRTTAVELQALREKVASQIGAEEAAVFAAHETILNDPAITERTRREIVENRRSATASLQAVLQHYETLFSRVPDEYLRERLADLRDVIRRLIRNLSRQDADAVALSGPLVLVCHELLPSDVVALTEHEVVGIVTQTGGATSHAALLARGFGIPAVSGIGEASEMIANGDRLIVDGRSGHVFVHPDAETEKAYRKLQRELTHLKESLAANRDRPAVSADGVAIELLANISGLHDAKHAGEMGAEGVGLYRTEFLFLTHPTVPDENEQTEAYRRIIVASPGNEITIRTLDIGGDKTVPYLHRTRELNPFMGWRSIRLSFEHPQLFLRQIRAILRAAAEVDKQVQILFPMVTTYEEVRRIRAMVRRARRELERVQLSVPKAPIGIMIEVPAAAIAIDTLLPDVDFVSIGSNDLVQYLTAADRDNPKVSHLCQPLNPGVLKVLSWVVDACCRAGKPVTICGEMAASPSAFPLLFGMGLRSFSMSPALLPSIKDLASRLTVIEAKRLLDEALRQRSAKAVAQIMDKWLDDTDPQLRLLEPTSVE